MTWTYRVVKQTCEDDGHVQFAIWEVYSYGGKLSSTVDHKAPIGTSLEELRADLEKMLQALDRPVLEKKGDIMVEVEVQGDGG